MSVWTPECLTLRLFTADPPDIRGGSRFRAWSGLGLVLQAYFRVLQRAEEAIEPNLSGFLGLCRYSNPPEFKDRV